MKEEWKELNWIHGLLIKSLDCMRDWRDQDKNYREPKTDHSLFLFLFLYISFLGEIHFGIEVMETMGAWERVDESLFLVLAYSLFLYKIPRLNYFYLCFYFYIYFLC